MQNLINASQKSATQQLYNDIGTIIPYYKENPAMSPLGTQFHNQSPTIQVNGSIANKSTLIDLPAGSGFLYEMSVSCLCTGVLAAGDLAVGVYPGMNIVRALQFESGGKIFVYKTKNALFSQFKQEQNETLKLFSFAHARALNPTTELSAAAGDTSYLTYIPFTESFLTKPEKQLLLDNMKDLKLRIFFDTTEASGLSAEVSTIQCSIVAQSYAPKMSVFTEMKLKDWSKNFVMEMVNTDEEVWPLTGPTTTTLNINTSFLVSKSHLFIRKNTNAATTTNAVSRYGLPLWRVESVIFKLNGQTFLDGSIKPSRLGAAAARYGNTSLEIGSNFTATAAGAPSADPNSAPTVLSTPASSGITYSNDMITFDWGILCGRNMNSGTAYFNELRGSSIVITYSSLGLGTPPAYDYLKFSAYLEHEYLQGVEYAVGSGGNGGILSVVSVA